MKFFRKNMYNVQTFLYFCKRNIKSSRSQERTHQPSIGSHGGQYDVVVLTSKTFQIMKHHIYYIRYALQFADMQIPELVTVFNAQVQNRGWSSMRAYHDRALIDEFQRRGIDFSAVYDGKVITFAHTVRYDLPNNKLVVIN